MAAVLLAMVMTMGSGLALAGVAESPGISRSGTAESPGISATGVAESPGFFDATILLMATLIM
jgi:hypothetical protein